MNRLGIITAFAAGSLLVSRAFAQFDDEAPPVRLEAGYASSHVFRGVERADDSAQATLEFARGRFRGGAWLNQPLDADDPRETSLNAAYAWETSGSFNVEATLAHTWFANVPGVDRSLEAGLIIGMAPAGGFTPSLAYYHDFRFDADSTQVSFARSIALTRLGAFLEVNFFAGWVGGGNWRPDATGPRLKDSYGFWGGKAHLPYRVGPRSTVVAGLHFENSFGRSIATGPFGGRPRGQLWVTLGVNLDF